MSIALLVIIWCINSNIANSCFHYYIFKYKLVLEDYLSHILFEYENTMLNKLCRIITVIFALTIGTILVIWLVACLFIVHSKVQLNMLKGGSYDVVFEKGFFVTYLAQKEYSNILFIDVSDEYACFNDPLRVFNRQNLGDNLKRTVQLTTPEIAKVTLLEKSDGSFCLPWVDVSQLKRDGQVIWMRRGPYPVPSIH